MCFGEIFCFFSFPDGYLLSPVRADSISALLEISNGTPTGAATRSLLPIEGCRRRSYEKHIQNILFFLASS
jgi:hypothetical protein